MMKMYERGAFRGRFGFPSTGCTLSGRSQAASTEIFGVAESSISISLYPLIKVATIKMDTPAEADNGQFFLENEVLNRLFTAPKVYRGFFDVQENGLDVRGL